MIVSAPVLVLAAMAGLIAAFVVDQSRNAMSMSVGGIEPCWSYHWQMNMAAELDIAMVKQNWLVA